MWDGDSPDQEDSKREECKCSGDTKCRKGQEGGGGLKHTWKYTLVEKVSGFRYSLGIICSESRFSELITHLILIRK